MSKALLQLDDYWVNELALQCSDAQAPDAEAVRGRVPRVRWDIHQSQEGDSFLISMSISDQTDVHKTRIKLAGAFSVSGSPTPDERSRLLALNGPSILYGVARGLVGQLTGATLAGRRILPAVNFFDLHQRRQKADKKNAAT